ncbi:serine/threonine-protein kinase [Leptolyngbya sp. BC1307]|uniref:serine/threonine-protein kinase n=1 Tax=Leptolyngbya sp. BC1307 TaxID=2029589 RepID=UPI000EFD4ECC|nr:serine/threonine-protein kinase [Leptolyngbya sp. BC1307]
MTYCIATGCPQPKNAPNARFCKACGSQLWLRDRYRALGLLGRGGFGATFLARDQSLPGHPPCVIKQLRPTTEVPNLLEMARDLFQREASILGKIGNHPQLPRLLDYFEIAQEFYLVQEYVRGATLQKEVRQGGPFTEAGVKQFLTEILPVVQYIHSHKIIHRDIKPANLIRREEDKQLVMIDFGAVKDKVNPLQAGASEQTALTAYAIGTPGYAPPEQMALRPVYASDIYAVGVTCVYLLTGRAPKDLPYDPRSGELRWQDYAPVSDHLNKVLCKMLDTSVRNRYQMAGDVLRDLDLEPYLDSLSQNLAFATVAKTEKVRAGEVTDASEIGLSPSSRMAAAIRARRERQSKTGETRLQVNHTAAKKLTAQSLKEAYNKGQRDFSNQIFSQLDLQKQTLTGASFAKATFRKTNLLSADLSRANLSRANLSEAKLKNAKLENARLDGTNLTGADLRGANLTRASLELADLTDANLCGADLTGATVSDTQLAVARTNWSTIHTNGRRLLR